MPRAASALIATAFLLTACAATDTASPSPAARPSIPPGLEQIADKYLQLVDVSNAATCAFNAVLSQSAPTLADLKRASADYAESLITLITALRRLDWPAELGDDASALIYSLSTNYEHTRAMSVAQTLSEFIGADNQLIEANAVSAAAAGKLRDDLGLGSTGNPCVT